MGLNNTRQLPVLDELDAHLLAAVADGLPLQSRPYAPLALQLGLTEAEVLERIRSLHDNGIIKRYGVVVRHRELGYRTNGMVVWDIADAEVGTVGRRLAKFASVTLCYRRPRHLPHWPYNLFTMIHGRTEREVREKLADIVSSCGLQHIPTEILFSTRRFKQRGANYRAPLLTAIDPQAQHAH